MWINKNRSELQYLRSTPYNNSVAMNKSSIEWLVKNFDNIFNNITNFTDEISSIIMYPFNIRFDTPPEGYQSYLETARGVTGAYAYNPVYAYAYMDLGQHYIEPKYNNYLDYNGYTKIQLYLPYLGFVDLDTNTFMGKWLQIRLSVDYFTGSGLYIIGYSNERIVNPPNPNLADEDLIVVSTVETAIGFEIPLGTSNIGDIKRNLVLGAVKIGASLATGIPPLISSSEPTSKTVTTYNVKGRSTNAPKGTRQRTIKSGTETVERFSKPTVTQKIKPFSEIFSTSADTLNRTFGSGTSDRINSAASLYSLSNNVQIIISRPKLAPRYLHPDFVKFLGKPAGVIGTLSYYHGYTEITDVHFDNLPCTLEELTMIEELLQGGVILPYEK